MSNWVNYLGWEPQRELPQFFKRFVIMTFWVNVRNRMFQGLQFFLGRSRGVLGLLLDCFSFWKTLGEIRKISKNVTFRLYNINVLNIKCRGCVLVPARYFM